jgi:oligosaccharide repeat unit polymerase
MSLMLGGLFLIVAAVVWGWIKDALHPAVVYSGAWGVTLAGIGLAEPFDYYQVSSSAGLVFVIAGAVFISGATLLARKPYVENYAFVMDLDFRKLLLACFLIHIVMIPVATFEILSLTSGAEDLFQAAFRLRINSVTGEETVGFLTGNYITLGLIMVPILMAGFVKGLVRGWLLVAVAMPWVVLGLLVSGRVGVITLTVSCFYVFVSMGGKITSKTIVAFMFCFITILISGNLLVGKIEAEIGDGVRDIAGQSIKGFFDYFFAGPILFSRYYSDPTLIVPTWDALIFPCHVLEKIGMCSVPMIHQEFLTINTEGDLGNVYSIVFSILPKYGFLGLLVVMFFYGLSASYFHCRRCGSLFSLLMAGFLFYATILSIYLDGFGTAVYFFIKVYVVCILIENVFLKKYNQSLLPVGS